jgi:hypothetical protein
MVPIFTRTFTPAALKTFFRMASALGLKNCNSLTVIGRGIMISGCTGIFCFTQSTAARAIASTCMS